MTNEDKKATAEDKKAGESPHDHQISEAGTSNQSPHSHPISEPDPLTRVNVDRALFETDSDKREYRVDGEGYIEVNGKREFVGLLLAGATITR